MMVHGIVLRGAVLSGTSIDIHPLSSPHGSDYGTVKE